MGDCLVSAKTYQLFRLHVDRFDGVSDYMKTILESSAFQVLVKPFVDMCR